MQVVVPNILSMLDGTTVTEKVSAWDETKTYAIGDTVVRKHYVYTAVQAVSVGVDPAVSHTGTSASWKLLYISNPYACLDWYSYTQTVVEGDSMTLVVPWARGSTAFALLNMAAVTAEMTLSVGENADDVVYQQSVPLLATSNGWWEYLFGKFEFSGNVIKTGLPPMSGKLKIRLVGKNPALGMLVVGRQYNIGYRPQHKGYGRTQLGASARTVDYSTQEMDTLGAVTWVPRNNTGRVSMTSSIHPDDVNGVTTILKKVKSSPALWLGDNGLGSDPLMFSVF